MGPGWPPGRGAVGREAARPQRHLLLAGLQTRLHHQRRHPCRRCGERPDRESARLHRLHGGWDLLPSRRHARGPRRQYLGQLQYRAGLFRRYGVESARKAAWPPAPARRRRQCLLRRAQARSALHHRLAVALCPESQYPGRGARLIHKNNRRGSTMTRLGWLTFLFLVSSAGVAAAAPDYSGTWEIGVREFGGTNYYLPMQDGRLVLEASG